MTETRSPLLLNAMPRVLWSVLGDEEVQMARLQDVTTTGCRLVTAQPAGAGELIFLELLGDGGEKLATGLGEVTSQDRADSMLVSFLALGVDQGLLEALRSVSAGPTSKGARPPPMPAGPTPRQPPPMPVVVATVVATVADPFAEPFDLLPLGDENLDELEAVEPEIEAIELRRQGMIIGIDLGTTNTCASYVLDGQPRIIPGRTGTSTIPSMITFDPDGTWYVGQRAADRQILYPLRTVYGSKRLVGRTFRPDLAAELQQHFAYPLGEADGHRFGVRIDDRVISMDTIAARVLDEVRSTAEEHLKMPVEGAVITVPAYFTEVQREAVRRAAREANLTVHRIVNEPTAAAVAYGHRMQGPRSRVAVWDFGGGTFDFSIVEMGNGRFEVLTTGGDNFVGGSDFDDQLASYLLSQFQRAERINLDPDPQQIARLREAAEVAKRALSVESEHLVELPDFTRNPRHHLRVEVTRDIFEGLCEPLVRRTLKIAREVMNDIDMVPSDIDEVILVGGTTRIPAVERSVADLFLRRPSKRINPDEAVALGAALLADEIGSSGSATLLDVLPMSVGRGVAGQRFEPIVARNSRLPTQQEVICNADLLGNVTIPLFQGDSAELRRNEYLCSAIVEDRSLWDKGRVKLQISFDEHCMMVVEATNVRTGKALPVRLDRTRSVDEVLRDLGADQSESRNERPPAPPPSLLGQALGKLFKMFGR